MNNVRIVTEELKDERTTDERTTQLEAGSYVLTFLRSYVHTFAIYEFNKIFDSSFNLHRAFVHSLVFCFVFHESNSGRNSSADIFLSKFGICFGRRVFFDRFYDSFTLVED
mgnify:CR=1 FL=1